MTGSRRAVRQVRPAVRLNTPVAAIRRAGRRVRIEHRGGATTADFCVCTLPAHLLARIPSDFSPAKKAALQGIDYLRSVKVAFESPRFWETDEHLYGGLAWTDRLNENVIYPSDGFNSAKGVLVAAYAVGWTDPGNPDRFASLSHESGCGSVPSRSRGSIRAKRGAEQGRDRCLGPGALVRGGRRSAPLGPGNRHRPLRRTAQPEGPIVFAGEHLSYLGLWPKARRCLRTMREDRSIDGRGTRDWQRVAA